MSGRAIECRGVELYRGETHVLGGLDLRLCEKRIAIIGANGSGKSSFARLLNALLVPDAGRVLVDGLDTREKPKEVRRKVGFMFQNPDNQIVYPTVAEDVAFGLERRGLSKHELAERVRQTLARFGLDGFEDRLIHQLSGGERQLVALAGVMAVRPDWLVLDEPTALLDRRNRARILAALDELPLNVILITHDLEAITAFGRAIVFDHGRVFADDRPAEAIAAYQRLIG